MRGPRAANKAEAIRLWNALPREEPWIAIDETLAERDAHGFLVAAIPRYLDIAFSDGTTAVETDLNIDELGWYAENSEGLPIGGFGEHRKVATHYRKHVPPRHPLKDKP